MPAACSDVITLRQRLHAAGFMPLPLNGKKCLIEDWSNHHDTNDGEIALWAKLFPQCDNTGILCRNTPTLDIDILDPEAAEAVEDFVRERFEDRGHVLVRIGKAPKRAIPFRCAVPFKKITVSLVAPKTGGGQALEFLGDGQQVAIHGIHPDTAQPYRWHGGELGSVKHEDLPKIDSVEALNLIEAAADLLCRDYGYSRTASRPRGNGHAESDAKGSTDWGFLIARIRAGQELHDSLRDLAAKMIASGTDGGAATNFLRGLMDESEAPHDARWQARYDDIPRLVAGAEAKFNATDAQGGISEEHFYAYMPMHTYLYVPTREMWPAGSVNSQLPPVVVSAGDKTKTIPASEWLDKTRHVEQATWAPGHEMLIKDRLVAEGGWIQQKGASCFNLYRPPELVLGNADDATRWLNHVRLIYPSEAEHIICWLGHRVQRPHEKINHAIVLGGLQGIGKDTLLEPVKAAIGPWNFAEVSPQQLLGRFNGFLKSVILRVSEARDLGDVNRFAFYEHLKAFTAAPPDVLRIDEKHLREHSIFNVVGVILTTNYKSAGIYLPADDRRHFVAWSMLHKENFEPTYFAELWRWYRNGGIANAAAYLHALDLSAFDPKAPPIKTPAFWDIVDSNRAPEDAELADALDQMKDAGKETNAVTLHDVALATTDAAFADWLRDKKNRRVIPHRFEQVGYVPVRNPDADDGLWKLNNRRQVVYARVELSFAEQIKAARKL
jgi:hypothetical protein